MNTETPTTLATLERPIVREGVAKDVSNLGVWALVLGASHVFLQFPVATDEKPTSHCGLLVREMDETESRWRSIRSVYQPRTELGRRILEIRAKMAAKGMRFLNAEEIDDEIASLRERSFEP